MARDANGNYILPLPDVLGGQPILADWANETMNDLGDEMTDSLSRSGKGGMLTQLTFVDGSAFLPGIAFTSQPNTGFYFSGPSDMRASINGGDIMRWTTTGVDILVDGQFQPVLAGSLDADIVNYNNANQQIITGDEVQTALDQLSLVLSGAIAGITLRGTWDADNGNQPGIDDDPEFEPEGGDMFIVDVAGNTLLDAAGGGPQLGNWIVGQRPVFVGSSTPPGWVRLAAIEGVIASEVLFDSAVFDSQLPEFPSPTQVQAALDFSWQYIAQIVDGVDVDASDVAFTPQADIEATNVQDAIVEVRLDAPQLATTNNFTEINQFTLVPSSLAGPLLGTDLTNLTYVNTLDARITDNEGDIEQLQSDIGDITASGTDFDDIIAPPTEYLNVQTGLTAALDAGGTRFDPTGLIPEENVEDAINFLADFIAGVVGGLEFRGDWDASDGNPPDFDEDPAVGGNFWIVSVAGTTSLPAFDGGPNIDVWDIGDRAIYLDNANGTGYIKLIAATSLPASSVTFNSFNFDNAFPALPSPDDVQEALDVIWAPLARVVDGGIIISPTPLTSEDLNTLGNPDDAGWYLQEDTPGGGLNYPEIASGMLQVVASALAGVTQVYYASGGIGEGGTIYHRISLANGANWSDWDTGLDQSALDEHAALVDATAPLSHLTNLLQTIGGQKIFQLVPSTLQDPTADNDLTRMSWVTTEIEEAIGGIVSPVASVFGRTGIITALVADYVAFYLGLGGGTITGSILRGSTTFDSALATSFNAFAIPGIHVQSANDTSAYWLANIKSLNGTIHSGLQCLGNGTSLRLVTSAEANGNNAAFGSLSALGTWSVTNDVVAFFGAAGEISMAELRDRPVGVITKAQTAIILTGGQVQVTFGTPMPSAAYSIQLTFGAIGSEFPIHYLNKLATGFLIVATGAGDFTSVDWTAIQNNS